MSKFEQQLTLKYNDNLPKFILIDELFSAQVDIDYTKLEHSNGLYYVTGNVNVDVNFNGDSFLVEFQIDVNVTLTDDEEFVVDSYYEDYSSNIIQLDEKDSDNFSDIIVNDDFTLDAKYTAANIKRRIIRLIEEKAVFDLVL